MGRPIGDICLDISRYALEKNHEFLSYILRLAATEAYQGTASEETFEFADSRKFNPRNIIAGVWDWDISRDRNHGDAGCAAVFGVDPLAAARGLPIQTYRKAIHPDDIAAADHAVRRALRSGGLYQSEYRVIAHDRIRWVFARGFCTLNRSGQPVRLPGALVDITHEKLMH